MSKAIKHENRAHAVLSASSADRWLHCPASVQLEAKEPQDSTESDAAKEGTAAHELCEWKVRGKFKLPRGRKPKSEYFNEEMDDYTDGYVEYAEGIAATIAEPNVWVEQRVTYSEYAPGGFGTADLIILGDKELHVIDFKYGKGVLVEATQNPQLKLYALGILSMLEDEDVEVITLHIYQPRRDSISEFSITTKELLAWGEYIKPIAKEAYEGSEKQCAGRWCKFCKVASKCRARAADMFEVIDKSESLPAELTDEEIDELLPRLARVEEWCKTVRDYAQQKAIEGTKWKSYKLVLSRTSRKYADEAKVAERLESLGYTDIYNKKLLGLADMQKLMGKEAFESVLKDLIVKPEGNPVLAPRDDKREEIETDFGFKSETENK